MIWKHDTWVIGDVETTGLRFGESRVIELGLLVVRNLEPVVEFSTLLDPQIPLSPKIVEITGIKDEMLEGKPRFEDIADQLQAAMSNAKLFMAYNAAFDQGHIEYELGRCGHRWAVPYVLDPLIWVREIEGSGNNRLTEVANRLNVKVPGEAHRALVDCYLLLGVAKAYLTRLPDDLPSMVHLQHIWKRRYDAKKTFRRKSSK